MHQTAKSYRRRYFKRAWPPAIHVWNEGEDLHTAQETNPINSGGRLACLAAALADEADLQMRIDGLWALQFGNGHSAGPANTLYFTAGTFDEAHAIFGSIVPIGGQDVATGSHRARGVKK